MYVNFDFKNLLLGYLPIAWPLARESRDGIARVAAKAKHMGLTIWKEQSVSSI